MRPVTQCTLPLVCAFEFSPGLIIIDVWHVAQERRAECSSKMGLAHGSFLPQPSFKKTPEMNCTNRRQKQLLQGISID